MGGGQAMGQMTRLLAVAIFFSCGQLINCSGYYKEGDRLWCTLGVSGDAVDACQMMHYIFPDTMRPAGCYVYLTTPQDKYTLHTMSLKFDPSKSVVEEYLNGILTPDAFEPYFQDRRYWPNTLQCYDIDECAERTGRCSPNAACYNNFFGYTCECLEGFKDKSPPGPHTGYICEREEPPPEAAGLQIEIWVYILIGIAGFVVLMLVVCCCCFYSTDSCCGGSGIKHVKHIKVLPSIEPPKEKKIVIEIEKKPEELTGHSAFIANSNYDGKVYVAPPALPWHSGGGAVINPPQIQVMDAPAPIQVVQQPEVQYIQQQPAVQVLQTEPMVQQYEPIMMQSGGIYSEGTMVIQ